GAFRGCLATLTAQATESKLGGTGRRIGAARGGSRLPTSARPPASVAPAPPAALCGLP
ncbi:hypothetical protein P7K49_026214, partial [Saguinus oedipus]